jgi:RimJ/RimL family protein N-acetyltransferase
MLTHDESLTIRSLTIEDAAAISLLLKSQSPEYARFFYAFSFDESVIAKILAERVKDVYSGIFWEGRLLSVLMLRGWDAGYEIPSFGVLVDETYRGHGFIWLALDVAKHISKLRGAPRLMLKLHPDNISEKGARRRGARQVGVEAETGNVIYHLDL